MINKVQINLAAMELAYEYLQALADEWNYKRTSSSIVLNAQMVELDELMEEINEACADYETR